jgi:hypothetical protein
VKYKDSGDWLCICAYNPTVQRICDKFESDIAVEDKYKQ